MTILSDSDDNVSFLMHRLEECTAAKDSQLAIERQENNATKEELDNAHKKIKELVNELQHFQETRKQLEDIIKRSDTSLQWIQCPIFAQRFITT
jgi:septal ring factor EnvC (AmiA/AmiB activator)